VLLVLKMTDLNSPLCSICKKPIDLTVAKTDEDGKAIHEECYLLKFGLKRNTARPPGRSDQPR
jgi:hypothetical protein